MAVSPQTAQWPPDISSSNQKLDQLGTTAIARCAPTNPTIDLTNFIGEGIKEGLPKLMGSSLFRKDLSNSARRKAIGSEYLNYQFGYKPLADDLAKIANYIVSTDKAVKQYQRDAGKLVRRRYEFPIEESVSFEELSSNATPWISPSGGSSYDITRPAGRVVLEKRFYRRRWFSGAFTYVVPSVTPDVSDSIARTVILAKKSLGLRLTPTAIWNLTPWS
jgi:hypothetical protein